nr:hypothetical protein [Cytophagales bacterium]
MKTYVTVEKDKIRVDNDSMQFLQKVPVFTVGTITFSSIKEPDFVGKRRNDHILISLTKGCLVVTSAFWESAREKPNLGKEWATMAPFFLNHIVT